MKNKTLLVSLVSDQTIPNVQIIKEIGNITNYLFLTTDGMEKKGTRKWIENTCSLNDPSYLIVEEYSVPDIEAKLYSFNFDTYDKIYVNLSGGTKVMTLVVNDFFKKLQNVEILYVTGKDSQYIKLFPSEMPFLSKLSKQVSIIEYLTSYGFTVQESKLSGIDFEQTKRIFQYYCENDISIHKDALVLINKKRGERIQNADFNIVSNYLNSINFNPEQSNKLSEKETKYLSGDWFEEYIGLSIKNELELTDNDIFIGREIKKEIGKDKDKNKLDLLLGDEAMKILMEKRKKEESNPNQKSRNEMDVMFMYDNCFYSIECKSSIIAYKTIEDKNGNPKEKPYNILGETIYKSDSLKNKFGLFAKTSIITLTDFIAYCNEDKKTRNNKIYAMEELIGRANLSNIKLIDKSMLVSSPTIFELIK